jgi:3-carboxy-cis,cis-muconate cycloisomerase
MLQEHERAVGGWQSEWTTVSGIVQSTGLALESMVEVAEGLTVEKERMRQNIDSTGGAIYAEKAMMQLAPKIGRDAAHRAVKEALRKGEAVSAQPEEYLGCAEAFRQRLLATKE